MRITTLKCFPITPIGFKGNSCCKSYSMTFSGSFLTPRVSGNPCYEIIGGQTNPHYLSCLGSRRRPGHKLGLYHLCVTEFAREAELSISHCWRLKNNDNVEFNLIWHHFLYLYLGLQGSHATANIPSYRPEVVW